MSSAAQFVRAQLCESAIPGAIRGNYTMFGWVGMTPVLAKDTAGFRGIT